MRMRVDKSSDSRSPLASNSHVLSATLIEFEHAQIFRESQQVLGRLVQALRVEENCNFHESQLSAALNLV